MRPVDGEGGDDRVDAGPVWQAGVDHGRGIVDAPPDGRDDAIDHLQQVLVVLEAHVGRLELAVALDVHLFVGVDENVRDLGILPQRLERPEPEDLVHHLCQQPLPLLEVERCVLLGEEFLHDLADPGDDLFPLEAVEVRQVQALDQLAVDPSLNLLERGELRSLGVAVDRRLPWERATLRVAARDQRRCAHGMADVAGHQASAASRCRRRRRHSRPSPRQPACVPPPAREPCRAPTRSAPSAWRSRV